MALDVAIALAVFTLPGFLVAWAAGMRPHRAIVGAIPITAGVWGVLAAIYGATNIPFTLPAVAIGTVVVLLLARLWGSIVSRRTKREETPEGPKWYRDWRSLATVLLPLVGVIAGATLMLRRGLAALARGPHGADSIFQGWDVLWHASVVRFIMDEHVASATHMGELQNVETKDQLFYPSAWHSMIFMSREVSGISPIAALNITAMVLPSVGLALTVSLLAWIAVRGKNRSVGLGTVVAAFLAPIIVAGLLPLFYVGTFVSMWPYVAATALIGPIVWLFRKIPSSPAVILPAALALVGVAMMHPAPAVYAVIILLLWWLGEEVLSPASKKPVWGVDHRIGRPILARVRGLIFMGIAGLLAVAMLVPQFLIGSQQSGEVESFTDQQDVSRWKSWTIVLYLQSRFASEYGIDWWLIWLGLAGMILLVLWRRRIWLVAAYWFFALVAVDSVRNFAGPVGSIVRKVGALHYNTTHRLIFPVAMLTAVFAAAAIGIILHLIFQYLPAWIARHRNNASTIVALSSSAGAVLALILGWQLPAITQAPKEPAYDHFLGSTYNSRLVDQAELDAYDWLAEQPKAYEGMILNNPDEGAGWMYAYNGLQPLHRHYLWPNVDWEDATMNLFWHTDQLGRGLPPEKGSPAAAAARQGLPTKDLEGDRSHERNLVDEGADKLGINYIISSPPHHWHFQNDLLAQGEALYKAPGVTPVYQDGNTIIYAVNAHFTHEQLQQILANSPRPPQGPPVQEDNAGPSPITNLDPHDNPREKYFVPERGLPKKEEPRRN